MNDDYASSTSYEYSFNPLTPQIDGNKDDVGKRLLELVRTIEHTIEHDKMRQLLILLESVQNSFMRKSLLSGDTEPTTSMINSNSNRNQGNSKKKSRGRKRMKRGEADISFNGNDYPSADSVDQTIAKEDNLILSALCRLLNVSSDSLEIHAMVAIRAGADTVITICRRFMTKSPFRSNCSSPMGELMGGMCSRFLVGLSKIVTVLADHDGKQNSEKKVVCNEKSSTLASCFKCISTIIMFSGTRLRNTRVLEKIRNTAQTIIWNDQFASKPDVLDSIFGTITSLPLASNPDGVPPSKLWSETVHSTVGSLNIVLNEFFPTNKDKHYQNSLNEDSLAMDWIKRIRHSTQNQSQRTAAFKHKVEGLVALLIKLINLDGFYTHAQALMTSAVFPTKYIFELVELMLKFGPAAEFMHSNSKSALRDIPVENGILSANAAVDVANSIKSHGLELFDNIVSCLNRSSIQYGKSIIRLIVLSLQSCCTIALRSTVEGISLDNRNNNRKWLHASFYLRAKAVKSFQGAAQTLGANIIVTHEDIVGKGIVLVVGSLLEQISISNESEGDEHWGTLSESLILTINCIECIAACLTVFGGYMSEHTRKLVESISCICLQKIKYNGIECHLLSFSETKIAILKLAISCVSTPWPDGGASSISALLLETAATLKYDQDIDVSAAAYTGISICNTVMTPRTPALVVPSSGTNVDRPDARFEMNSNSLAISSIDSLMNGIETATKQMENNLDGNILNGVANNDESDKDDEQIETLENVKPKAECLPKKNVQGDEQPKNSSDFDLEPESTLIVSDNKKRKHMSPNIDQVSEPENETLDSSDVRVDDNVLKIQNATDKVIDACESTKEIIEDINEDINEEEYSSDAEFPDIVDCNPDEEF